MTDQQWRDFAARVPAGTIVCYAYPCLDRVGGMGVLTQAKPYQTWEWPAPEGTPKKTREHYNTLTSLKVIPFELQPEQFNNARHWSPIDMLYLIDGQWLSFDQVMALEVTS